MQTGIFTIHLPQLISKCDPFLDILMGNWMSPAFPLSFFVQVGLSEAEAAEMVSEADQEGVGSVGREAYFAIMKNAGWF